MARWCSFADPVARSGRGAWPRAVRGTVCYTSLTKAVKLGLSLKMYANESPGEKYPRMQGNEPYVVDGTGEVSGCNMIDDADFTFDCYAMYPEYLSDWNVLRCPSDENYGEGAVEHLSIIYETVDNIPGGTPCPYAGYATSPDESYLYIGWMLDQVDVGDPTIVVGGYEVSQQLFELFINKFTSIDNANLDTDASGLAAGTGNGGGTTVYRLREGIERFLIEDINNPAASARGQSDIPLVYDIVNLMGGTASFNHVPGGANVLYLDGHAEWIRYPSDRFHVNAYFANIVWYASEVA